MKHILLGLEDSEEAADAIALAGYLARRTGAKVVALSAFPFGALPASERQVALEQESEELFSLLRDSLSGVDVTTKAVCDPSPSRALTELAEETEPDLIVLGSTHRSTLGRVYPGSVGERLLHGSPCPVAVAPRGYAKRRHLGVGLIGVGYRGTVESDLALEEADQLARALDAAVRVIAVYDGLGQSPKNLGYNVWSKPDLEDHLRAASKRLGDDIESETVMIEGVPAPALVAEANGLDLLVLGSRSYGPLRRTLLGGVSAAVMRSAPCPVIVTPRGVEIRADGSEQTTKPRASTV